MPRRILICNTDLRSSSDCDFKTITYFIFVADKALKSGSGVKFKEFLQFVVDESNKSTIINDHWSSIHDLCHPCLMKYNYIAKVETYDRDSKYIQNKIAKDNLTFPNENRDLVSKEKKKELLHRYYSDVSKDILDKIREIYRLDFELFGYDKYYF